MFVHTFFSACAIIIDVTPPIHYIVLLYPIRNEIPSPEKTGSPTGLFAVLK